MCNDCFPAEIRSFPDAVAWTNFDLALTQKLAQGKMRYRRSVSGSQRGTDGGVHLYECRSCGQQWKLKDQDSDTGGYFRSLTLLGRLLVRLGF